METTLLFIDDEPLMRTAFVSYFEDLGYRVLTAADGREGLRIFGLHNPDVVLVDLRMPEMSGLLVLETINGLAQNTPVIVVSGVGQLEDVIQALKLGAWDFITKPVFDMHLIEMAIHRSLERVALIKENYHYRKKLEQEVERKTIALAKEFEERQLAEAEKKILREQLIQAQKMESIGRLAGGIAHDFNNTLTAIIGFSELALMELSPSHSAYNYIELVKEAGEKAADITHQLLAFSRKQVLTLKPLSLSLIVQSMLKILKHVIKENISLSLLLEDTPQVILADTTQIEQIIMNLVLNAKDAMTSNGRIEISTKQVTIFLEHRQLADPPPGEYALLSVKDNGEGMSEVVKQRIFEPFFTTKERGKGTGLGLSTVFGIVKQHNGYIFVESTPQVGSTFFVYFPLHQQQVLQNNAGIEKPTLMGGSEVILIVDDEAAIRKFITNALTPLGYVLHEAADATEALAIAGHLNYKIDLLLTDIKMPGMNGYELAHHLKAHCAWLKVIYMSGYADDDSFAAQQNERHFLQKPLHTHALACTLRAGLDAA